MTDERQKPTNDAYRAGWDQVFRRSRLITKCSGCHHEWQGETDVCDWCGARGDIIGPAYKEEYR